MTIRTQIQMCGIHHRKYNYMYAIYKYVAGCQTNSADLVNYWLLKIVSVKHRHQVCVPHGIILFHGAYEHMSYTYFWHTLKYSGTIFK